MSARTTMQVPGLRGDLILPDHHGYDDARAVRNGTAGLFHATQEIAPAKRT